MEKGPTKRFCASRAIWKFRLRKCRYPGIVPSVGAIVLALVLIYACLKIINYAKLQRLPVGAYSPAWVDLDTLNYGAYGVYGAYGAYRNFWRIPRTTATTTPNAPTGIFGGPLELQQLRRLWHLQDFLEDSRNYSNYGAYGACGIYRNFWRTPGTTATTAPMAPKASTGISGGPPELQQLRCLWLLQRLQAWPSP